MWLNGLYVEPDSKKLCDKNTHSNKFWESIYTTSNQMCVFAFTLSYDYLSFFNDGLCKLYLTRMSEICVWELKIECIVSMPER